MSDAADSRVVSRVPSTLAPAWVPGLGDNGQRWRPRLAVNQ
jgi:hypothetical protein